MLKHNEIVGRTIRAQKMLQGLGLPDLDYPNMTPDTIRLIEAVDQQVHIWRQGGNTSAADELLATLRQVLGCPNA